MIKANELRIGNHVDRYIVKDIDNFGINRKQWEDDGDTYDAVFNEGDGSLIKPIPITPEILEKCGFEQPIKNEFWLKKGNIIYYQKHSGLFYYNDNKLEYQPEYLHQLQNLYFALTGEELEINL